MKKSGVVQEVVFYFQFQFYSLVKLFVGTLESSDNSRNAIVCFVCDPMCQMKKISSLFGTLDHNYVLCRWRVESGNFGSDRKV